MLTNEVNYSCNKSKKIRKKATIDDGMNPELVKGARFDGFLEIPFIENDLSIAIPKRLIPFSQRSKYQEGDAICFYEHDVRFSNILVNPTKYLDELKGKIIISPDCSLYRNAPLVVQMANVYKSRALGFYFQRNGVKVIPNIRWGGKWTSTSEVLPEKIAFLGVEKGTLISIGTYGCIQGKDNKQVFADGLSEALKTIEPKAVLVYGPMPESVLNKFKNKVNFFHYPNWISYCKGGKN